MGRGKELGKDSFLFFRVGFFWVFVELSVSNATAFSF
jgi:hypothetical protein